MPRASKQHNLKKMAILNNIPYVLPNNNKEMQIFCNKHKIDVFEQIVSSIEFAICNNLSMVEIFQFKRSQFVLTLSLSEFKINLDNIKKFYIKSELYELCCRITRLQNILAKSVHEKEKTKKPRGNRKLFKQHK